MNIISKVSFIGSGNASFRLAVALKSAGCEISYIWNRTPKSAESLVKILNKPEFNLHSLPETLVAHSIEEAANCDILILALSDKIVEKFTETISLIDNVKEGKTLVCHVSGSLSSEIMSKIPSNGVFYPLMTLSKNKPVDISFVPFLIEASDEKSFINLSNLAKLLGAEYIKTNSEERLKMHLAGVFVSNFVNYLIGQAYDISKPNHTLLLPLAIETVRKAFLYGHPFDVQTGPAIRDDQNTIECHKRLLKDIFPADDDSHRIIYELLTNSIQNSKKKKSI